MSLAIQSGPDAVAALLSELPASAEELTTGGARPLHVCAMSQRGQHSAELLIAAGAAVDPVDTWGYTPLQRMATNDLGVGAAALLRAGADRLRPSGLEGTGESARELALRLRSFAVLRAMQRYELERGLPRPDGEPLLIAPPPPAAAADSKGAADAADATRDAAADASSCSRTVRSAAARCPPPVLQLSSGLTFEDGEQILISVQKPLGLLLKERDAGETGGGVVVAAVGDEGSAAAAGVLEGDWLLAVNNQDVSAAGLEEVMARIVAAPRALNLRFARGGGA